jgi:uncharacterized membrane protein YhaH (DUF805 family)
MNKNSPLNQCYICSIGADGVQRMYLGPILKKNYGNRVRQMYWVITMVVMVLMANMALIGLQRYLCDPLVPGNHLIIEIWFALLALAVALTLIFRRLRRNS